MAIRGKREIIDLSDRYLASVGELKATSRNSTASYLGVAVVQRSAEDCSQKKVSKSAQT